MKRELILLSPYRLPAKDALMLGDEDVAAFLNAYTALWHPAALYGAVTARPWSCGSMPNSPTALLRKKSA